jgi:hypothetical protein
LNTQPHFIANPEGEAGQFIKASVQTDGTFSVQIGREGTLESYPGNSSKATASENQG